MSQNVAPSSAPRVDKQTPPALVRDDVVWTLCLLDDCREDPDWCGHDQEQAARVQMVGVWDSSGRQRWLDPVEEYGPLTDATPGGTE